MKFDLSVVILLIVLKISNGCFEKPVSKHPYPATIAKFGLQTLYDSAMLNMYRLNACCACNCKAFGYTKMGLDTVDILNLSLNLENLSFNGDSISFWFSLFKVIDEDTIYYQAFSDNMATCQFNGLVFIKGNYRPICSSFGEALVNLKDSIFIEKNRENFNKCIEKHKLNRDLIQLLGLDPNGK